MKSKNGVFNYLEEVEYRLENKLKPDGSRFFPAKSCKDLKLCHPNSETGTIHIIFIIVLSFSVALNSAIVIECQCEL